MNKTRNNRDPIKSPPLHDPGQSLREKRDDYLNDNDISWGIVGLIAAILIFLEWFRWLLKIELSPVWVSFLGALVVAFCAWKISRAWKQIANDRLGLKGERATGQHLQKELMKHGYQIFHDICDNGFNIDHVVVGPGGVFSVETKTRSLPKKGKANISYDGEQVLVDGHAPDRDPVKQAMAGAKRVQEIILDHSGHDTHVRPVVIFPCRWVDKQPHGVTTWVLNEKAFTKWVLRERPKLSTEQQKAIGAGIARYIRECDAK